LYSSVRRFGLIPDKITQLEQQLPQVAWIGAETLLVFHESARRWSSACDKFAEAPWSLDTVGVLHIFYSSRTTALLALCGIRRPSAKAVHTLRRRSITDPRTILPATTGALVSPSSWARSVARHVARRKVNSRNARRLIGP